MAALALADRSVGRVFLEGFYRPDGGGGGEFLFEANRPRGDHDGGIVIAAGKRWNGSLADWFSVKDLTGRGCWVRNDPKHITFEMFGARAEWRSVTKQGFDNSAALRKAIASASRTSVPIVWQTGVYGISRAIKLEKLRGKCVIEGAGAEKCGIILTGFADGLRLVGDADDPPAMVLRGFRIGRHTADSYTGVINPKTIYVGHCSDVTIEGVEEFGAIGFGIQLDHCGGYVVRDNHVHDHKGGSAALPGTDGIHIYRSSGPGIIAGNRVERVGDDPISLGSFHANYPTRNFVVTQNRCRNTSGGIKIYGNAYAGEVHGNWVSNTDNGGVILWDDRDVGQSFDIHDIAIFDNDLRQCGRLGGSAGVYLCQPEGSGRGWMRNIDIRSNRIADGHYGVTLYARAERKSFEDILIDGNVISGMAQNAVLLFDFDGGIDVVNNQIVYSGKPAIRITSDRAPGSVRFTGNVLRRTGEEFVGPIKVEKRAAFELVMANNRMM